MPGSYGFRMTTLEAVPTPPLDAIIVSGGGARRLGGYDKTSLVFEGLTLLEHAMAAVTDARRVCIVGRTAGIAPHRPGAHGRRGPSARRAGSRHRGRRHGSGWRAIRAHGHHRGRSSPRRGCRGSAARRDVPGDADGMVAVDGAGQAAAPSRGVSHGPSARCGRRGIRPGWDPAACAPRRPHPRRGPDRRCAVRRCGQPRAMPRGSASSLPPAG